MMENIIPMNGYPHHNFQKALELLIKVSTYCNIILVRDNKLPEYIGLGDQKGITMCSTSSATSTFSHHLLDLLLNWSPPNKNSLLETPIITKWATFDTWFFKTVQAHVYMTSPLKVWWKIHLLLGDALVITIHHSMLKKLISSDQILKLRFGYKIVIHSLYFIWPSGTSSGCDHKMNLSPNLLQPLQIQISGWKLLKTERCRTTSKPK